MFVNSVHCHLLILEKFSIIMFNSIYINANEQIQSLYVLASNKQNKNSKKQRKHSSLFIVGCHSVKVPGRATLKPAILLLI